MSIKIKILRKILEHSNNKLNIFGNKNIIRKCIYDVSELFNLITTFLSNQQIVKLFEFDHFRNLHPLTKQSIFNFIIDVNLKLDLLNNSEFLSNMEYYQVDEMLKSLNEYGKVQILHNTYFLNKYKINNSIITNLMISLSDTTKFELLSNQDLVEKHLKLDPNSLCYIIKTIQDEDLKLKMLHIYKLENIQIANILLTCSDTCKSSFLLEHKYNYEIRHIDFILSSMEIDSLITFINEHNDFLIKNNISAYSVTRRFDKKKQLELVEKFENINLPTNEKRKILVTLEQEIKDDIDISNYSEEYKTAIEFKLDKYGRIIPDLDSDLEKYRGFDNLIYIDIMNMSSEDRAKLPKLFELVPDAKIYNTKYFTSTIEEFKIGTEWIDALLQQLDSKWSDIQKVAFIDNAIGKKISYSPDFETEIHNKNYTRSIFKIINSGYGTCFGIASLESYILNQIGISNEVCTSDNHAFIMLKDIEIKTVDAETIKGTTLIDPTWNLTDQRYGIEPSNFCISYDEIRQHDLDDDGNDCLAHKNDEKLSGATLNLDKKTLRQIYTSIGIASKAGAFPIDELIELSDLYYSLNIPEQDSIKQQFSLLSKYCPEFATCQNSTMAVLRDILLDNKNFKYNKCVVNRVYDRNDKDKSPILYVYVDFPQSGKKFYFADKDTSQFVELSQKEFEEKFECYDMDMKNNMKIYNCSRPWESEERETVVKYVSNNSENMLAQEGDVR